MYTCPPHLYTVATNTLPWEIQKSFFNSITYIYFRLFTLSQKETNCYALTHYTSQQVLKVTTLCTDTCFQSFSPLIMHSPPRCTEIQPTPQQGASATRPYCGLVLDTRTLAVCPRRGNLPGWGQDCWMATCQDWWTGVSHGAETRLCHEHDVLAHCLAGKQSNMSPAMLRIAGSSFCVSSTSR